MRRTNAGFACRNKVGRLCLVALLALSVPGLFGESRAEVEGRRQALNLAQAMHLSISQPVRSLRATFVQGDGPNAATITSTILEPDRLRAEVQSPRGRIVLVFTPADAFMVAPDGSVRDLPPAQKQDSLEQIVRDPIYLAGHWNDRQVSFLAVGTRRIGAARARVVDVQAGDVKMRWFVDMQTGRLLREEYQSMGPNGRVSAATDLGQWTEMGGLLLPAEHKNYQDGKLTSVVRQTAVEVNPDVNPQIFARPGK